MSGITDREILDLHIQTCLAAKEKGLSGLAATKAVNVAMARLLGRRIGREIAAGEAELAVAQARRNLGLAP